MPAAIRPYITAGVALVGASVISVTPIQPVQPQVRVTSDAYSLTANFGPLPGGAYDGTGDGVACSGYHTDQCDINAPQSYTPIVVDTNGYAFKNILPNLLNAFVSIPRAYLDAVNDVAYSMEVTGSWWVYTPTNVLGYDPADPAKITSITNLLIPFAALSNPLGEHLSWWAKANLPMNGGCTGTAPPTCRDANAILAGMFTAPIWDLIAGYVFPALNNPVSSEEGAAGEEIPGSEGEPVPWSGAHIQINPYDPIWNVINYMFADPELNRPEKITFAEVTQTVGRLLKGLAQDFYPFVPGSFLWKGFPYTLVTPFIKPFVKILCPACDPEHPEDPTPFDGQLPPSSQDGLAPASTNVLASLTAKGEETTAADVTTASADAPVEKKGDVVKTAIANLFKKFDVAPEETAPAADDTDVKTDTGTPAEAKPVETPAETPAAEETTSTDATDKGGPAESGQNTNTHKKWTFGKHSKRDEATSGDTDKGTDASSDKSSSVSVSKKREPKAEKSSASSSAGASSGSSGSGGTGGDSGE